MNIDDQSLEDSSKLLKDNDINFWVCHGTLLGIVRENRILPWDSDIDLAVWGHENNKEFLRVMDINRSYFLLTLIAFIFMVKAKMSILIFTRRLEI